MRSPTQVVCDNCIFRPTRSSRNKPKKIPPASEVQTFDYVYGLKKAMWDRTRNRITR
ncbi:NinE family protein [Dickeya poaceiphila]|uniref:NinE family protein n=2 Tax=Dickeya poaceiphila TaxID=568768 RepID=A0A5B8I6A9_9GAMM|nr:NinE family protein [Dickeya poaceiphila]QDX29528.1 NinE family protein [Dickeya poaceiphila]